MCVDEPHALTDTDAEPLRLPDSVPLPLNVALTLELCDADAEPETV